MLTATDLHADPLAREELIVSYLARRLDEATSDAFEAHYLQCDECFEELRAGELIRRTLLQSGLAARKEAGVLVLGFHAPTELTRPSPASHQLLSGLMQHSDSRVLIDLSRVTRIDSAGLGVLINCYSHTLRNRGMLKLLRPNESVRELFRLTRIDAVLETYEDESRAIESFTGT